MERHQYAGILCVSVDREAEVVELNWTDVLRSLVLSYDLLSATAEEISERDTEKDPVGALVELEARLDRIAARDERCGPPGAERGSGGRAITVPARPRPPAGRRRGGR